MTWRAWPLLVKVKPGRKREGVERLFPGECRDGVEEPDGRGRDGRVAVWNPTVHTTVVEVASGVREWCQERRSEGAEATVGVWRGLAGLRADFGTEMQDDRGQRRGEQQTRQRARRRVPAIGAHREMRLLRVAPYSGASVWVRFVSLRCDADLRLVGSRAGGSLARGALVIDDTRAANHDARGFAGRDCCTGAKRGTEYGKGPRKPSCQVTGDEDRQNSASRPCSSTGAVTRPAVRAAADCCARRR